MRSMTFEACTAWHSGVKLALTTFCSQGPIVGEENGRKVMLWKNFRFGKTFWATEVGSGPFKWNEPSFELLAAVMQINICILDIENRLQCFALTMNHYVLYANLFHIATLQLWTVGLSSILFLLPSGSWPVWDSGVQAAIPWWVQ